ncbi:MAG: DUF2807 domain-containing protein [Alphaproteobacteria bacterium]|nr:MAG: DUF2807 domain-containing protein [Alphaproteobacteria bacterium]
MKRTLMMTGMAASLISVAVLGALEVTNTGEAQAEEWNTETRDVDSFSSVRFSGAFEVEITVGDSQNVEISGSGDLDQKVQTRVKDGELEIMQSGSSWHEDAIEVSISIGDLEQVVVDGAAELEINGIKSDTFELRLPGAAEVSVSGTCGTFIVVIAGAASVDAEDLECDNVEISIAGTGEVVAYAKQSAEARISGLGSIEIYGNPDKVERKITGLGSIEFN